MQAGDIAAARALFGRAAQAGSNDAMLAMGATYDPAVVGNVSEARRWYQQAASMGNVRASMLLRRLPASPGVTSGNTLCGTDGIDGTLGSVVWNLLLSSTELSDLCKHQPTTLPQVPIGREKGHYGASHP